MKLYDEENFEWTAYKTKRPKFSSHRGRTWDFMEGKIDGIYTKFHLDTSWSFYCYFVFENVWYKINNNIWPDVDIFTTTKKAEIKWEK